MRQLEVFRRSDRLLFDVLARSALIARPDRYALCDQLRRSALSIPTNLVESAQRSTTREFSRYVEIAAGSAAETRYLLSVLARLEPRHEGVDILTSEYHSLAASLQALRNRMAAMPEPRS